jgi:gliding motility-associated-like protein
LYFGSYALVIEDSNGCKTAIGTYLNQPDQLEYDIYNTVDATCLGAENGQFWVHVNGGTGEYYYDFLEANAFPIPAANQVSIINDSLIFNLATGTHSIYVTDDNNCEGAVTFGAGTSGWQRDINALLTIPTPIFTLDSTTCYNTNNGAAAVIGPDPLYTYTWENDILGNPSGIDISNGANTSWGAFSPGDYWLVTHYADSASFGIPYYGCDNSVAFTIFSPTQIIDGATTTNISCYSNDDGQISLNITGGAIGPYDLYWDTTSVTPNTSNNANGIFNYILDSLSVGTYAVTITDAVGCSVVFYYPVTEPLPLISDIIATHVGCFGEDDGEAEVQVVSGTGTATYEYVWFPSGTAGNVPVAEDLEADTFWVTVIDNQGCSYTDTIHILEPDAPVASVEVDSLYYGIYDVSCYGEDDASAIATGSGVSFVWTDALGFQVSIDQHTATILSADVNLNPYTVTAKDANDCLNSVTITITEPPLLEISLFVESNPRDNGTGDQSPYHISCWDADDGFNTIMVKGGVGSYDIFWVNSAGDSIGTVSNFIISDTIIADNLEANYSYTFIVMDANGCNVAETTNIYTEPDSFVVNVTTINYAGPFHGPKNISFIDSTVSVEPYSFEWTWQDGTIDNSVTGVISSDYYLFIHEFLKDELDTNYVFLMLTNDVTNCQDSVEFFIEVQGMPEVNNVFTPNKDGINDEFFFSEYAMELVDVQIFNRWGQLVYTWVGSDKSWKGIGIDGKDLSEGVYFYVFEGKGVDGHHYDKKGSVTLLR